MVGCPYGQRAGLQIDPWRRLLSCVLGQDISVVLYFYSSSLHLGGKTGTGVGSNAGGKGKLNPAMDSTHPGREGEQYTLKLRQYGPSGPT